MKIILRIIITLALLLTSGWAALTILLPIYLQTSLLPDLATRAGIQNFQPHLPHIGLSAAGGGFQVGSPKAPSLAVSSLTVHYTLADLVSKKIKQISLSGVELRFIFQDNQLRVADSSLQNLIAPSPLPANDHKIPKQQLPVSIENITIKQATVICQIDGKDHRIPFEAQITLPSAGNPDQAEMVVDIYHRGQQIRLTSTINQTTQAGNLALSASKLNPQRFNDLIKFPAGVTLHGLLDLSAQADLQLAPFRVGHFQAALSLHEPSIAYHTIQLGVNSDGDHTPSPPVNISIKATKHQDAHSWSFLATSSPTQLYANLNGNRVDIPSSALTLQGEFSAVQGQLDLLHTFSLSMDDENIQARIPDIVLKNRVIWNTESPLSTSGSLHFDNASLQHHSSGLQAEKMQLNLPLHWPLAHQSPAGHFSCKNIHLHTTSLGSLTGKIWSTPDSIRIETHYLSTLLTGFSISSDLVSSLTGEGTSLNLVIPPYHLTDFDPASLSDTAQGIRLSGIIAGQANIKIAEQGLAGSGQLSLAEGSMTMPEKELTIAGINSTIALPDLPELRSAPSQKIHFDSLSLKDVQITDGTLFVSLESPQSLFLEKGSFSWAEGSIHTSAIRFGTEQLPTELSLYCSKLKLATILQQMGIKNVSGDGALNGRIPITIEGNTLTFAESFLYSTPGQGGRIRIAETDYLTKSIPRSTPQFAQLDFAQAALRDFDYKWAKLHLNSEDDSLVLQLQLDGKPAQPLPFRYDSATGHFQRLVDQQGGIDQPIRLDVNFRFPLNTFLEYDRSIKEMLQSLH